MKKNSRLPARAVSLFTCMLLILALLVPAALAGDTQPEVTASEYPCVFVSGLLGWGEYDEEFYEKMPYWGMGSSDLLELFRANSTICAAASVGPISSTWDRACDLYAQLTGTVVDYGEAHSLAHGHERYGRSYVGNALLDSFGDTKINLFGHSFGGVTVRFFTYLLEYGAPAEVEASGDGVSPFFTGGKGNLVHSVTTLSSPNNGCVLADTVYDLRFPVFMGAVTVNALSSLGTNPLYPMKLEQFGLTADPILNVNSKFSFKHAANFEKYGDNCCYDLSLAGMQELNALMEPVDSVYYFCYTGCGTKPSRFGGNQVPTDAVDSISKLSARLIGRCSGRTVAGIELTDEWEPNDGLVPVISGLYPFDEPHSEFTDASACRAGTWSVMPVVEGGHSVYITGGGDFDVPAFFSGHFELLNSLS